MLILRFTLVYEIFIFVSMSVKNFAKLTSNQVGDNGEELG